jgi:hypothetical protein
LVGRDEAASLPPFSVGTCQNSSATRRVEGYEITFGRPGDELDLDVQEQSFVDDGPGNGQWKVLLGFVQWKDKHFVGVASVSDGTGRRYAGVQADVVAARGGNLSLRTRTNAEAGKPALIIDDDPDHVLLQFGKLTSQGSVTALFSVNEKGDVIAAGKFIGALSAGAVQVESGIASDGMILPLPPGITQAQLENGEALLHVHISPRICEDAAPSADIWLPTPIETWVDLERRLRCRVRWFKTSDSTVQDHPGVCHYLIVASVKETERERQDASGVRQTNRPRGGCLHPQC